MEKITELECAVHFSGETQQCVDNLQRVFSEYRWLLLQALEAEQEENVSSVPLCGAIDRTHKDVIEKLDSIKWDVLFIMNIWKQNTKN